MKLFNILAVATIAFGHVTNELGNETATAQSIWKFLEQMRSIGSNGAPPSPPTPAVEPESSLGASEDKSPGLAQEDGLQQSSTDASNPTSDESAEPNMQPPIPTIPPIPEFRRLWKAAGPFLIKGQTS